PSVGGRVRDLHELSGLHLQYGEGIRRERAGKAGSQAVHGGGHRHDFGGLGDRVRIRGTAGAQRDGLSFGVYGGETAELDAQLLRRGGAIHDLQEDGSGLGVPRGAPEDGGHFLGRRRGDRGRRRVGRRRAGAGARWRRLPGAGGDVCSGDRKDDVAAIVVEHLLGVVRRRAVAGERVIADQVG